MHMIALIAVIIVLCLYGIMLSLDVKAETMDDWEEYIEEVCEEYGICPELVQAVIEQESSWDPKAENKGCIGLMQLDPIFHGERMRRLGITDLKDPYDNILAGVDYLAELFRQYQDVYAVLMFYNAGYSREYGLLAYEQGKYSDYAIEVSARAQELERRSGK